MSLWLKINCVIWLYVICSKWYHHQKTIKGDIALMVSWRKFPNPYSLGTISDFIWNHNASASSNMVIRKYDLDIKKHLDSKMFKGSYLNPIINYWINTENIELFLTANNGLKLWK